MMIVPEIRLFGCPAFPRRGFSRAVQLPLANCGWRVEDVSWVAACDRSACCHRGASLPGWVVVGPVSSHSEPARLVRCRYVSSRRVVSARERWRAVRRGAGHGGRRSRWGRDRGTRVVLHRRGGTLVGGREEADEEACELGVLGGGPCVLDEGAGTRVSGRREAEWLGGSRSCVGAGVRLVAGIGWAAARECCSALEPRS